MPLHLDLSAYRRCFLRQPSWLRWVLVLVCLFSSFNLYAKPVVKEGLLDLSQWNFERDGSVELNGDWQFFWNQHLDSDLIRLGQIAPSNHTFIKVPGNWNDTDTYSHLGFATYRLEVLLADARPLALKFRTVGTAYRLIVDGQEIAQVGIVGQSALTSEPRYRPGVFDIPANSNRLEIIIQTANFDHRNAGLWESILLGEPEELQSMRESRISIDLFLFGAITMMAFYNLITWVSRRENVSGFWLGLFCLIIGSRILFVDERYIDELFASLDWATSTKIEYFTWFVSIPIFLAFIRSIFPTEASRLVLRCLSLLAFMFSCLAVLLPITQATQLVPAYQALTLLGIAYGIYCLLLAIMRRKEGSILFGLGSVFLFLAATSDIATVVFTLDTDNYLQFGLFAFVLLQSIQVSLRSSKAFHTVEAQSSELKKTNLELHIQEKLRRAAEGESQALSKQVDQTQRTLGFGVVAQAVVDREGTDREDTDRERIGDARTEVLASIAKILRGEEPDRYLLDLEQELDQYFRSDTYLNIRADHPLIDVSVSFESDKGHFLGGKSQLETLLYHLTRYSLGTQIHAQQVKISGRSDHVYAGSLFHHQVSDGDYYIVSIEDQGQGIRPEDLVEIFDPGQRANGYANMQNSQWDLAVVWMILEDHGGALDLHTLAESTRLELYFPVARSSS